MNRPGHRCYAGLSEPGNDLHQRSGAGTHSRERGQRRLASGLLVWSLFQLLHPHGNSVLTDVDGGHDAALVEQDVLSLFVSR